MCRRITLIILFLFITTAGAFAATFTVTSNADSGPGTLREALTKAAANGSAETDYIIFNLPSLTTSGRTITLASQLPEISANIVIDGETQPGGNFGMSNAKVEVFNDFLPPLLTPPIIFATDNVGNFTMRGLYLTAMTWDDNPNAFTLTITNSGNVTVEDCLLPGGNILIDNCKNASLKSNMIGYMPDGLTGLATNVTINNTLNVVIGGGATSEGNFFSGDLDLNMFDSNKDWTYLISHNKMGTDYTGKSSSESLYSQGRIDIESGYYTPPSPGKMHGTITDNMIENFSAIGIVVSGFGDVAIKGNLIGTDEKGIIDFSKFAPYYVYNSPSFAPTGIVLQVGIDATVGGLGPGDGNKIAYISNGILEQLANHVVISENSIYCLNRDYFNIHDFVTDVYAKPLPQVRINTFENNHLAGTATPGARVELFSNDEGTCASCEPRTFFTYVTASPQGKWAYNGPAPVNVVASAIYNGQTSLFTKAKVDVTGLTVKQPHCGDNTGAISGIKYYNAGKIRWIDDKGKELSNTVNIDHLPPGRYKFKLGSDVCGAESDWINIEDNSVQINAGNIHLKQPACNKGGSIAGIEVTTYQNEPFNSIWLDKNLKQVGSTIDITDLNPGEYTLQVTGKQTGCTKKYGPIKLLSSSGPLIDQSTADIQSTNCGQSTGSITNITATGSGVLKYIWTNGQQQQVGVNKDLLNQPAGVYKLQVTDDTQCGPVYTTDITIPETNGITLDESKATKTIASCGQNNGTITGIAATGATKYQWTNAAGSTVSVTANLTGVPSGDYTLTVSNSFGCSKTSQVYHIDQQAATAFPEYTAATVSSCFQTNNGSVSVTTDGLVKNLRWVNASGSTVGTTPNIQNLAPGNYTLYLTDQNGCEQQYKTYTVAEEPEYKVANYGNVTDDQCGLKTGGVSDIAIAGGVPPYTYKWTDAGGNTIGTNNSINNLAAGEYKLNVLDSRCGNVDITYTVKSILQEVSPPSVSDVQLCSSGSALLSVNNGSAETAYRLYETSSSGNPISEKAGGRFTVNVNGNRSYFISQLNGTCESSRAEVKVSVGLSVVDIANAFTPNGDGINDYWQIKSIENYPSAIVQVFSRYGEKIFESKGYNKPFDGATNGKQLPAGVYYYIINLNTNCNLLSGSLTIVR